MAENSRPSVKVIQLGDDHLRLKPIVEYLNFPLHCHSYHHALNLGYLQPDSLDPDGIIYSSSDFDVPFSITFGKIIGVE